MSDSSEQPTQSNLTDLGTFVATLLVRQVSNLVSATADVISPGNELKEEVRLYHLLVTNGQRKAEAGEALLKLRSNK